MKAFFVNDRLAFGSAITSWQHVEKLRAQGITHVVNLRWSQNNAKVRQFPHIWLRFHDDKKPRPIWFYRRALKFYQRALQKPEAKILVMCHHGLCRSPSLTYFFLRAEGARAPKAADLVRKARSYAMVVRSYRESSENYVCRKK
jgi:protein-tyrosine phosphatase